MGPDQRPCAAPHRERRAGDRVRLAAPARAASASTASTCANCRPSHRRRLRRSATAPSFLTDHEPANAVDGQAGTDWQPTDGRDRGAVLSVDYGVPREFGVLALRWRAGAAASRYVIELSDDGERWRGAPPRRAGARRRRTCTGCPIRKRASSGSPSTSRPTRSSRWPSSSCGRRSTPTPSSRSSRRKRRVVATRARMSGEQSYWTVLGVDGGRDRVAAQRGRRARAGAGRRCARALSRRRRQRAELGRRRRRPTRCATATCRCRR